MAFANEIYLDVRTAEEFSEEHIPDSINIDVLKPDFKDRVTNLDGSDTYKVYCRLGSRANKAVLMMQTLDFKNLKNLGTYANAKADYEKLHHGSSSTTEK
jgi:rhodanese-related sulfurtransferase